MPKLIFYLENDYPQVYDLSDEKVTIGRTRDNDISLKDSRVSVFHAEIITKKDGALVLNDLDSHNGTIVNGKPVDDVVLKDGDQIKFGSIKALFEGPAKAEIAPDEGLKQEAEGLMRKSQIERNNLKLIKDDAKRVRAATESAMAQKAQLETALNGLSKDIDKAKADLDEKKKASEKMATAIKDAQTYEKNITDLKARLKDGEETFEDLGKKIEAKKKAIADLDLEGATKQKEKLVAEQNKLSEDLKKSGSELEKVKQEVKEATVFVDKAKVIEKGISDQEAKLEKRKSDNVELEKTITARETDLKELGKKIVDRNRALDELNGNIEDQKKEVEVLAEKAGKHKALIDSSSEKLATVEAAFAKGRDELIRSQEAQKSLLKESVTLSQLVSEKSAVLQRVKDKIFANQYGTSSDAACPPLRVINPGMRSLVHYFHSGAGVPDQDRVDPIGYYGLAACTRGSMHREADSILSAEDPFLVMLSGDYDRDNELIETISRQIPGGTLLVSWSRGQFKALSSGRDKAQIVKLITGVAGIVSVDPVTSALLEELDPDVPHLNIPLPCPVEIPEWNLCDPTEKKNSGIFVSGDGFDASDPLHSKRLELINELAKTTKSNFTLYQQEEVSIPGLAIPQDRLKKTSGFERYSEYLKLMIDHRLVTGFGQNLSGGDISGDALLARSVFIGGDSDHVVDELLFPETCIKEGSIEKSLKAADQLLSDPAAFVDAQEHSQNLAPQLISFETVSDRLKDFIHFISANPAGV